MQDVDSGVDHRADSGPIEDPRIAGVVAPGGRTHARNLGKSELRLTNLAITNQSASQRNRFVTMIAGAHMSVRWTLAA